MQAESREACKRIRKLSIVWKTVITHRLKKLKNLHAVEKLTAWRRCHGFDRCDVYDGQWFHSPLLPTPKETTVSMLEDVRTLKKETSLSGKERLWQRSENFLIELEGGAASLTDEGFTRLKRIMKRRGRAAAHVIIAPSGTAQPSNPRPRCSAISFDVSVCMGEIIEGKMDPEGGELEASLAGMGLEASGQQCLTVNGCLLVDGSSDSEETTFSLEDFAIGTQTDSQTSTSFASSKLFAKDDS